MVALGILLPRNRSREKGIAFWLRRLDRPCVLRLRHRLLALAEDRDAVLNLRRRNQKENCKFEGESP